MEAVASAPEPGRCLVSGVEAAVLAEASAEVAEGLGLASGQESASEVRLVRGVEAEVAGRRDPVEAAEVVDPSVLTPATSLVLAESLDHFGLVA